MPKPLLVISKENPASVNIRDQVLRFADMHEQGADEWNCDLFDMVEYRGSIVEIVPSHDAEYYVFASTHKSESGFPCLTVHTPGNWGRADLGGEPERLNFAHACKVKEIARKMHELSGPLGWKVSVEVDHHGPSLDVPVLFAEIGSKSSEWNDIEAGKIVAQAIIHAMGSNRAFPCKIGFGGSHYAPKFTPKIVGGPFAFGHIISGMALERFGTGTKMVEQAIKRNVCPVQAAEIDWKGVRGQERKKLIEILDELGMRWERA